MFHFFAAALLVLSQATTFAQNQLTTQVVYLSQEEISFFELVNRFRAEMGLDPLVVHVRLLEAAKKQSTYMQEQDFLSHYGPEYETAFDRIRGAGYTPYAYAGENIACGSASGFETFIQFVDSLDHLKNLMNPQYKHTGISRMGTGKEKCPYYWTHTFGSFTQNNSGPSEITDATLVQNAIHKITQGRTKGAFGAPPAAPVATQVDLSTPIPTPQRGVQLIQCRVPKEIAKNGLSNRTDTDTVLEFSRSESGFKGKIAYLINNQNTGIPALLLGSVSVLESKLYPVISLFSAPGSRIGGFSLLIDTSKNRAEFSMHPSLPEQSTEVSCTYKF